MRKIFIPLLASLFFVACSNKNSNTFKDEIVGDSYDYYNHKLSVPNNLKDKLYKWVDSNSNLESEINDDDLFKLKGSPSNGYFNISAENYPRYFKTFKYPVEIKKIKFVPADMTYIQDLNNLNKDQKSKESFLVNAIITTPLKKAIDSFSDIKLYDPVTIVYIDNVHEMEKIINLSNYNKNSNEYIIDNPLGENLKTIDAEIVVTSLKAFHEEKSKELIYRKGDVSFYIKDLEIENDIVRYNLKNIANNEDLIRTIAKKDPIFFRILQNEKYSYNLDDKSILRLPVDSDINYSINHIDEILNTGEYLTVNNVWKAINVNSYFPNISINRNNQQKSSFLYQEEKRPKIENNSKKPNFSNREFRNNNFIDLDGGI